MVFVSKGSNSEPLLKMTDGEVIRLGFTELSRVLNLFAGFQRSVASLDELISPHVSLFWGIRWICNRQWRVQLQRSIQLRTCASIRKFRERLPFLNALRCHRMAEPAPGAVAAGKLQMVWQE